MTIRDYVERRARLLKGIWLVAAVAAAVAVYHLPLVHRATSAAGLLLMGVCAGAILTDLTIKTLTKCPRCRWGLGSLVNKLTRRWGDRTIDVCPHCGVSLDEPFDPTATNTN